MSERQNAYAARADSNQTAIVAALRKAGASVQHLHTVGSGCPDLMVGFQGRNYLMEIKTEHGRQTPQQAVWFTKWQGQAEIVRNEEEALIAIGAIDADRGD
jgi:hypothetical protein